MTKEEIKKSLKELKNIDRIIESNKRQLLDLKVRAENVSSFVLKCDVVCGGPFVDHNSFSDRGIDLEKEIIRYVDEMEGLRLFWKRKIRLLPTKQSEVLENYYFENKTWEQVCFDTHYCWSYVHVLHSLALDNLVRMNFKAPN